MPSAPYTGMRVPILAAGSLPAQIIRTPAREATPGFCWVKRMRGSAGSTADSESSAAVVDEHARYVPPRPLRRFVAGYTGYRQRGMPPGRHRGLPSPYLTLIFTLDEPLTIAAHPDPGQPPGEFGALLGGLHSAPALITHDGAQSGIQVALRPLGARALLGLPAGELADLDVPAEAVLGGVC